MSPKGTSYQTFNIIFTNNFYEKTKVFLNYPFLGQSYSRPGGGDVNLIRPDITTNTRINHTIYMTNNVSDVYCVCFEFNNAQHCMTLGTLC